MNWAQECTVNMAISNAWEYTPTVKQDTTGNSFMFLFWVRGTNNCHVCLERPKHKGPVSAQPFVTELWNYKGCVFGFLFWLLWWDMNTCCMCVALDSILFFCLLEDTWHLWDWLHYAGASSAAYSLHILLNTASEERICPSLLSFLLPRQLTYKTLPQSILTCREEKIRRKKGKGSEARKPTGSS